MELPLETQLILDRMIRDIAREYLKKDERVATIHKQYEKAIVDDLTRDIRVGTYVKEALARAATDVEDYVAKHRSIILQTV